MKAAIVVVGLGPGSPGLITKETWDILGSVQYLYLRTQCHPTVQELKRRGFSFLTLDHFYREHDSFPAVYQAIAAYLLEQAKKKGEVVYAVPGHPLVGEESVALLTAVAKEEGVKVTILPAVSSLDVIFNSLNVDPINGVKVIDACSIEEIAPDQQIANIVLQLHNPFIAADVKLNLMEVYPAEHPVTVIRAAGVPGEEIVVTIPLYELDRIKWVDHLTSLYIPVGSGGGCRYPLDPLVKVMGQLRSDNGCPWDKEQTHLSLRRYLLEECYEVIEALEESCMHKVCEELGDLLLQIVFHAQLALERGDFNVNDVVQNVVEKMIRRHPHVFSDAAVCNSSEVLVNWEIIKRKEKGSRGEGSILNGIPQGLPALLRAEKLQGRASTVGFDWENIKGAWDKVEEELGELKQACLETESKAIEEEIGDLLFAVVNVSRFLGVEPETALTRTNNKFLKRFNYIEEQVALAGKTLNEMVLQEMDRLWEEAKNSLKSTENLESKQENR